MPTKYSPGVLPDDGTQYFTEGAAAGLSSYFQMKRQNRLDREQAERDALDDALKRGELYEAGIRDGAAPRQTISSELEAPGLESRPAFGGQGLGMQPAGGPTRSPLAPQIQRAGMAKLGSFQANGGAGAGAPPQQQQPELLAVPGAFVPEIGGFTSTPIFAPPPMPQMAPETMDVPDPTKVQLTPDRYLDTEQTPEGRARTERSRVSEQLARYRDMDPTRAKQAMELLEAGVPASVVFQDADDPATSAEELIAAGIPPELAPIAARDPALARQWLSPTDGFDPDTDPALLREGVRRERGWVTDQDDTYDPATDAVLQRELERERLRKEGILPRGSTSAGGDDRPADAPTFSQAYDIVQQRYAKRSTSSPLSPIIGFQIEEAEMVERARALARGEDPETVLKAPPAPRDSIAAGALEESATDQPGIISRGVARLREFFRGGADRARRRSEAEGMPVPAVSTPATGARPDSLAQAREVIQGLPPLVQESLLRSQGYTDAEIRQIVGGGGGR